MKKLALATLSLLVAAAAARAASIGVDFGISGPSTTLAPTDSAGVAPYAQTHFNHVGDPTAGTLYDNSGIATSIGLTLTGTTDFSYFNANAAGTNEFLNNGNAYVYNAPQQTFTLTNIPYANYTLVVYALNLNSTFKQGITADGTTYYLSSPTYNATFYLDNNEVTAFTYTRATSTNPAAPTPNSDYALFTGLSGSTLTITDTVLSGTLGSVSGFQIIQIVPGPGTWALVGLGIVGLGVVTLRRRWQARA